MYRETCPDCGSENWRVVDTRPTEKGRRRRKECLDCGNRWSTIEYAKGEDAIAELQKKVETLEGKLDTLLKVCARLSKL